MGSSFLLGTTPTIFGGFKCNVPLAFFVGFLGVLFLFGASVCGFLFPMLDAVAFDAGCFDAAVFDCTTVDFDGGGLDDVELDFGVFLVVLFFCGSVAGFVLALRSFFVGDSLRRVLVVGFATGQVLFVEADLDFFFPTVFSWGAPVVFVFFC